MNLRKSKLAVVATILASFLLLAGCGSGASQTPDADPAPSSPGTTPAPSGEPAAGGELTLAFGAPILTLDPGISAGTQAQTVRKHIFETLVFMDEQGEIHPLLAEKWSTSEDGLTWTFELREGVTFHDGTPFNAEAVKRSLDRLRDPDEGLGRRSDVVMIESIEAVSDYVVEIKTFEPFGPLLAHLAMDSTSIVSPAALDEYGKDIGWNPVGTGPYRYESHVPEQSVTIVKNDAYWGDEPYLDKIEFITVTEDATRVTMLEAGEADIIVNVPGFEVSRLEGSPDVTVRIDPSTRVGHIGINTTRAPFDNELVRQALNYAVDRPALVQGILRGIGIPADSIVAPVVFGYSNVGGYERDVEKAKALLAEAGYPDGFEATLWTPQGRYYMDRETAVAIQAQLKEVGIDLNIEVIDWASYLEMVRKPQEENEAQLYFMGWESGTMDMAALMDKVFVSEAVPPANWNTMFYTSAEADALIDAGRSEVDQAKRLAIYEDLQKQIMSDAPWVPLYTYQQVTGISSKVQGVRILPTEIILLHSAYKN